MSEVETLYVMRYATGGWVQRDDSTGPMSSGGYPSEVSKLSQATRWTDPAKALEYRHICRTMKGQPWTLHRLELSTVPEIITPAMEAEASGDKEFVEYQRLAKKYGQTGIGQCPFTEPWIGKCKKIPEVGELYCEGHKKQKCFRCGAQATKSCGHTAQFVCGAPMCDQHKHHSDG